MKEHFLPLLRGTPFALWSMRRRIGQAGPVALALVLLVSAVQAIGMLHDVSSVITQQQVARNWRYPYDLLIRPSSAVSPQERAAGWIDPQSVLESYDGISPQQIAAIQSLPHITQVTPLSNQGWQSVAVQIPILLSAKGIYRISAVWSQGGQRGYAAVQYVEVTDLAHLTSELSISYPIVQHVLMKESQASVVYPMMLQAVQDVLYIPMEEAATLRHVLADGLSSPSSMKLSLKVERLQGDLTMLAGCIVYIRCWEPEQVQQGAIHYQVAGVQLVRYGRLQYHALSQQLAEGQIAITSLGNDEQGPLYREQIPQKETVTGGERFDSTQTISSSSPVSLPFSSPERLPLITNAIHFEPLNQHCVLTDTTCYSGLYVRLNDVEHYNQRSLALLQSTAAAISVRTGLHVDILDGSSLRQISLITSDASSLLATWHVVGVAVQLTQGVDMLQEVLLLVCALVCLLAIASAGMLVGLGRRKEVVVLQHLGWTKPVVIVALFVDGLFLCIPGCLLCGIALLLVAIVWKSTLPITLLLVLLGIGMGMYCCIVVGAATLAREASSRRVDSTRSGGRQKQNRAGSYSSQAASRLLWSHIIGSFTIVCAVFLIAIEYIMTMNFDKVLVVTVLGSQVRQALDIPQLCLDGILLCASFLTVGLCTTVLLRERRNEWSLLAMLGWERRIVMLRILCEGCPYALMGGEIGVLLALLVLLCTAALPSLWLIGSLIVWGPLLGLLLATMAMIGPASREIERAFQWK